MSWKKMHLYRIIRDLMPQIVSCEADHEGEATTSRIGASGEKGSKAKEKQQEAAERQQKERREEKVYLDWVIQGLIPGATSLQTDDEGETTTPWTLRTSNSSL